LGNLFIFLLLPDFSFSSGGVSSFMQAHYIDHSNTTICILRYLEKASEQSLLYEDKGNTQIPGYYDADRVGSYMNICFTTWYCVFLEGNIISWKSKKQNEIAQSTVVTKYRAIASPTYELVWVESRIKHLWDLEDEDVLW